MKLQYNEKTGTVTDPDGWVIATLNPNSSKRKFWGNLIVGAPELLEACREFVRKVECGEAKSVRSYQEMKRAISKATPNPM